MQSLAEKVHKRETDISKKVIMTEKKLKLPFVVFTLTFTLLAFVQLKVEDTNAAG